MSNLSIDDENFQLHQKDLAEPKTRKFLRFGDLNRFTLHFFAPKTSNDKISFLQKWLDEEVRFGYAFLWYPIALIAGAYFNFTRQNDIPTLALFFPLFILLAIRFWVKNLSIWSKYITNLSIACFLGAIAVNFEHSNDFILLDQGVTTSITGIVVAKEIGANNMPRYRIRLNDTNNPKIVRSPTIVQLVARSSHRVFRIGEPITGRARLSSPSGPVFPGGYDFSMAAMRNQIGAYGFFYGKPLRPTTPMLDELGLKTKLQIAMNGVRSEIGYRIRQELDGDAAAIASALIVSDRRAISKNAVNSLRASGLAHVLAISGLHMVLASGTFFFALRFLLSLSPTLVQSFPVKKIAASGAIIAASSYLAISGAPISAQRAWIMLVIILVAVLMDRPAITLRNVAIAAIIITITSPSAVMTPGFQMSFSAAAALIVVYTGWANVAKMDANSKGLIFAGLVSVFRFVMGLAATAIIAGLATGIFAVQHFHQFAGYGVLGNVLAMPIVTLLVIPLALISVLLMPFSLEAGPLVLLGWSIEMVVVIAQWVANLGSNIAFGKPSATVSLLASAGFVIFICLRSKLRYTGLAMIAISVLGLFLFKPIIPDILISEDGKLVGVGNSMSDATIFDINRSRPSKFILDQWTSAYVLKPSKPNQLFNREEAKELLAQDEDRFWIAFDNLSTQNGFECVSSQFCYFEDNNIKIATITDQKYLGSACHRADIVILSARLKSRSDECDQNKLIFDQNSLRRTGALAIYYMDKENASARNMNLNIISAIDNNVRPWTTHRYYNWWGRAYKMPSGEIVKYQPENIEISNPIGGKNKINDSKISDIAE